MKSAARSDLPRFVQGLRSRQEDVRYTSAMELKRFVSSDLKESQSDDYAWFVENLCQELTGMMNSTDVNERKGAVIGMGCIADVDFISMHSQYLKFANQVQSMGVTSDLQLSALQARLIGQFGLILTNDYIEGQINRACEMLTDDNKPEYHRLFSALTLREIALQTPTSFFQHLVLFIDAINIGIRDKQLAVRELCAVSLRAAFTVTAERECGRRKEKEGAPSTVGYTECFKTVFMKPKEAGEMVRARRLGNEDWTHGSLLLINEMLRCANADHEQTRVDMEIMAGQPLDQLAITTGGAHHVIRTTSNLRWPTSPAQDQMMKYRSLVVSSVACKNLIADKYNQIWDIVTLNWSVKSNHMIQLLLNLLPRLAAFRPFEFKEKYQKQTMDFLFQCLNYNKEKPLVFVAFGMIGRLIKTDFVNLGFLKDIKPHLKSNLPGKDTKKRSSQLETSLFLCISELSIGLEQEIFDLVKEMLDPMLSTGLSQPLTQCLTVLADSIPQLKKDIQDGLLKTLGMVLSPSLGTPGTSKTTALPGREVGVGTQASGENYETATVSLALKTLGTFDFKGHSLNIFVRHTANRYILFTNCEHKEVRLEAVRTCCYLMTPLLQSVSHINQASRTTLNTVSDILGKLLTVSTSDPEATVRLCVLDSLHDGFDPHLAQAGHLDSLLIALHDEEFEIREMAMKILGRLSSVNPACVQPSLRRVLLQTLTELENSGSARNKEQAARLLASLISTAPPFIQPYAKALMTTLMPKLRLAYPAPSGQSDLPSTSLTKAAQSVEPTSVLVAVFLAVGELAQVSGHVLTSYIDELFPILIAMMQDSSSFNKRKIAVWTLGQLVTNTGYVVKPFERNPELLSILLGMLKNEEAKSIRREVIRVLGLIGALDPFKLKIYSGQVDSIGDTGVAVSMHEIIERKEVEMSQAELLVYVSWATIDEFFAACSISALMQVLRDPGLKNQYDKIVNSIIFVFKALGSRSVHYLRQVMPDYLRCLREAHDIRMKEFLLHQLGAIMEIVKIHILEFMPEIVDLVLLNWRGSVGNQNLIGIQHNCISLMKTMVLALNTEFKPFLAPMLPHMLRLLNHETNELCVKLMLDVIPSLGFNVEEYLHILVPAMVRILDQEETNSEVKVAVLRSLARLTDSLRMDDLSGRIVQSVCRLLERQPELQSDAMDMLTSLLVHMGPKFMVLLPLVHKTLNKTRIQNNNFTVALNKVSKNAYLRTVEDDLKSYQSRATRSKDTVPKSDEAPIKRVLMPANPQRAWQSSKIVARDDWNQWLRTFSTALVRDSHSPAIRACGGLSSVTPTVAKSLFNAAFVSWWPQLNDVEQNDLIQTLEQALLVPDQTEVTQTILNLAEFTAHCEKGKLPLRSNLLADRAMKNRAYAKALYYKEQEFLEQKSSLQGQPTQATLSSLLSINNKLQLEEAASGVLIYATRLFKDKLTDEASWWEKLHNWPKALHLYERQFESERVKDNNQQLILGRMRCLRALGEWQQLNTLTTEKWDLVDPPSRLKMAPIAANSAWAMCEWEAMGRYVVVIPRDSFDGSFLRAVLDVHKEDYRAAQLAIDRARDILDADLTAMAGESYNRAYDDIVGAQMLSELEEVIQYKLVGDRRDILRQAWQDRLLGCQSVVEDWCQIIQIRSLINRDPSPRDDVKTWLRFSGLCRRSGRMNLSHYVLEMLLGFDPSQQKPDLAGDLANPEIVFSYIKHLWYTGKHTDAIKRLIVLTDSLKQFKSKNRDGLERENRLEEYKKLIAKCSLKLGNWYSDNYLETSSGGTPSLHPSVQEREESGKYEKCLSRVIRAYRTASEECPYNIKAWQSWSMANYAAISQLNTRLARVTREKMRLDAEIQKAREQQSALQMGGHFSPVLAPNSGPIQYENLPKAGQQGHVVPPGLQHLPPHLQHQQMALQMPAQGQMAQIQASNVIPGHGIAGMQAPAGQPVGIPTAYHPGQTTGMPVMQHLPGGAVGIPQGTQMHPQQQQLRAPLTTTNPTLPVMSYPGPSSMGETTFGQAAGVVLQEPFTTATKVTPSPHPGQPILLERSVSLNSQRIQLDEDEKLLRATMEAHSGPAVRGFVNCISLSSTPNLQDSLRLINLLFEFGHLSEILVTIREGFTKIRIENWLLVVQQLLARIDTSKEYVASIIVDLLITVGKKHPQAIINPLILAFKSGGSDRRRYNANKILYSLEDHSAKLVAEGFLLNEELIRLAISFREMWHECLEDASRVYFGDRDTKKMFKLVHPLHVLMDRPMETLNELAFTDDYAADLNTAKDWCIRYEKTGHAKELQQAWEVYYNLYRKLAKQVSNLTMLELTCASPRLANYGDDWVLAIPGSYEPNKPVVTIRGVKNTLNFITSKQRPRKMSFIGSDGHSYMFLLKGHEDIRQDERVMQFFGLVNTLLMNNPETFRRNLTIQRMSVIPLSTNTGLIGWVPNSDTLHTLIRDYREKSKILLNQEHRDMLKMAPDFDRLTVMQKTEVFEQGLVEVGGRDLANILWLKSHSSEVWFERRTNFIRSLATMSMVGYILGLGDRHPSNIMLCRESGKVIHIDFGDCFEVAQKRDKFPEKVPFRLTRMIIEAMEVTGIDGTFRHTCEQVMHLMRKNRESLLAVLEAFIHDPLLQWVLLEDKKEFNDKMRQGTNGPQQMQAGRPGQPMDLNQQQRSRRAGAHFPLHTFDPDYPESASLRNPHSVNPWRHHLCNGPWLGSYQEAKKMRTQTSNGTIIVERKGMQGFIFSAKPPSDEKRSGDIDDNQTNARARAVMAHIQNKLNGDETGVRTEVNDQVKILIRDATSNMNLCQMYIGWCPFW